MHKELVASKIKANTAFQNEKIMLTIKHGGSTMVHDCFYDQFYFGIWTTGCDWWNHELGKNIMKENFPMLWP